MEAAVSTVCAAVQRRGPADSHLCIALVTHNRSEKLVREIEGWEGAGGKGGAGERGRESQQRGQQGAGMELKAGCARQPLLQALPRPLAVVAPLYRAVIQCAGGASLVVAAVDADGISGAQVPAHNGGGEIGTGRLPHAVCALWLHLLCSGCTQFHCPAACSALPAVTATSSSHAAVAQHMPSTCPGCPPPAQTLQQAPLTTAARCSRRRR